MEAASDTAGNELLADIVHKAKTHLSEREREVFFRHSGVITKPETFKEIGESLNGMSKMGVCKIYKRAQRKLQAVVAR